MNCLKQYVGNYHLFASMGNVLAEQSFTSYAEIENGSMNGSRQNGKIFTGVVFINFPKDGENV